MRDFPPVAGGSILIAALGLLSQVFPWIDEDAKQNIVTIATSTSIAGFVHDLGLRASRAKWVVPWLSRLDSEPGAAFSPTPLFWALFAVVSLIAVGSTVALIVTLAV